MSAFGGKADIAPASQMSAYDPKRTLTHSDAPSNVLVWVGGMRVSPRASVRMRRREFLGILGGAAAWPAALKAQQAEHVRHVGVFLGLEPDDAEAQARTMVFAQALQQLGWAVGHNLVIDTRLVGGEIDRYRRDAADLVALAPDVIISVGSALVAPLQQATRTIPIVFVNVPDPVGAGFVRSMAHPGGNITGFSNFEYSMGGKWAELLKQIAPHVTRALVICDPTAAAGIGLFAAVRSVAQSLDIELTPVDVRNTDEIEPAMAAFARSGNGGVIVSPGGTAARRKLIISLAARYKLPTVYPYRYYSVDGGLISYGPNTHDLVRRAAGYVDRILKGEKPADMPVQAPTKYELVINLTTAKALGLTVPLSLLARADEVIE